LSKFRLLLLIHAHQPIGNFESVIENAYQKSYLPFVKTVERHPGIRIGLHISGPLLEWLDANHPDYFALLRELVDKGQIEMVGSGFYEPILISIPPEDRIEQIRRMSDYLEKQFGRRPGGAWLTERVWEPQLPATLSAAGVEYTSTTRSFSLSILGWMLAMRELTSARFLPSLRNSSATHAIAALVGPISGMTLTARRSAFRFTAALASGEAANWSTRRSICFLSAAIPCSCCIERAYDP